MSRDHLSTAGDHLRSAAEAVDDGDVADRLSDLADQLETLAERDSGPDHGRLARIQSALDDVQPRVSDDVASTVADASDAISSYRETLEGV